MFLFYKKRKGRNCDFFLCLIKIWHLLRKNFRIQRKLLFIYMDYLQKKFPSIPPDIILKYYLKIKSVEETALLLGTLYDKSIKSYIQYEAQDKKPVTSIFNDMKKQFPILTDESIRIIIENSNFKYKKSVKNAKKILKSYEQIKSEKNPKIKDLFERIQELIEELEIDELTFLLKINGSKIKSTIISFQHYKRLNQLIDKFLLSNYEYSPEVELSDKEWEIWDPKGNESDDDDDDDKFDLLNPVMRLHYFFQTFSEDQIRNIYYNEAKKNFGAARRILRQRKVAEAIVEEFPSATDEEIRDAFEKADGDERNVAKIIQNNKIENPVIEESVLALRPDLTMKEAKEIVKKAKNPNDPREILELSNQLYPQKSEESTERSKSIQNEIISKIIENEELISRRKKLESFSKILKLEIKPSPNKEQSDSSSKSINDSEQIPTNIAEFKPININMPYKNRRNISVRSYGPTLTLDLHGKRKPECIWFVENVLNANKNSRYSKINFITGKGKHSLNKVPILRPLVMEICEKRGLIAKPLDDNNGVVQVDLV